MKCEHGRQSNKCRDCGGQAFCIHEKRQEQCKECGGRTICKHGKRNIQCKRCGTNVKLLRGGFTKDEIIEMSLVKHCQFPGCRVEATWRQLNSDHYHDDQQITTENYRGEICRGHNVLLVDLDQHPEWANMEAKEYMNRRPYSRLSKAA
jgi:hypothetical protein